MRCIPFIDPLPRATSSNKKNSLILCPIEGRSFLGDPTVDRRNLKLCNLEMQKFELVPGQGLNRPRAGYRRGSLYF
jgi:hypothetical protein